MAKTKSAFPKGAPSSPAGTARLGGVTKPGAAASKAPASKAPATKARPALQRVGKGGIALPFPKLPTPEVQLSKPVKEAAGVVKEKFPADFTQSLALLKAEQAKPEAPTGTGRKAFAARIAALKAHIFILQNGPPPPAQDARHLKETFKKQTDLGRLTRVDRLARGNKDIAWLRKEAKLPAAKKSARRAPGPAVVVTEN